MLNEVLVMACDGAYSSKYDIAGGGVSIHRVDERANVHISCIDCFECGSTNQRAEILGFITALKYLVNRGKRYDVMMAVDSRYVYDTVTKGWLSNWHKFGWVKRDGEPVKNPDLWADAYSWMQLVEGLGCEINMVMIPGHTVSLGKVTTGKLYNAGYGGMALYNAVVKACEGSKWSKALNKLHATQKEVMGYAVEDECTLKMFVALNVVADSAAGNAVLSNMEIPLRGIITDV